MRASTCAARLWAALALAFAASISMTAGTLAFEEDKGEKDRPEACERDLCGILVKREAAGGDLQCSLRKTWAGSAIKQGVEEKKLSWSMGDVRCSTDVAVKRQDMLDALTKPAFELKMPTH